MRCILLLTVVILTSCGSSAQEIVNNSVQAKAVRKPLTRVPVKLEVPANYDKDVRADGTIFDHKPRVVVIDENAGKYEFRWIGYNGKEQVLKYQRNGAIDVIVSAKVERKPNSEFLYTYSVENLPNSPNRLSGFTVQTFAAQTKPIELDLDNILITEMFSGIRGFSEGKWWSYGILDRYKPVIVPGSRIELQLESPALPGLVGCKADGGEFGSSTYGEDPPPELEKLYMGTKDWPYGYTIGPIDKLSEMSKPERAKYILDNLPKFIEAGWMSDGTARNYEAILKREDLAGAFKKAKKDLENEFITSEVFHIIEGLNQ